MRVVIEVVAGPLAGRKFHLVRNQRLEVGSTARADVCVRGDTQLAPQQFALETDQQVCRLKDISRLGNTLVNGQAVESAVLKSGDEVAAGASRFVIHVEGDAKNTPVEVVAAKPAAPAAAAKRSGTATYDRVTCDTGLVRYGGDIRQYPPAELAAGLAAQWAPYLLADNRRLQDESLKSVAKPRYLFDWLGEAASQVSPLVLAPGEADLAALVARGWRKDGLVAFFAKEPGEAAIAALMKSARAGGERVVGVCWPSILSYLLSHYHADFVKQLTDPFVCVLLEDPAVPERWQLYAAEPMTDQLQALGFHSLATETK
jgi:hypothetical protein